MSCQRPGEAFNGALNAAVSGGDFDRKIGVFFIQRAALFKDVVKGLVLMKRYAAGRDVRDSALDLAEGNAEIHYPSERFKALHSRLREHH